MWSPLLLGPRFGDSAAFFSSCYPLQKALFWDMQVGHSSLPLLQIFAQFTFPMTLPHHPVWNSSLLPHHCPPSESIMSPLSSNTLLHVLESNSKHIFIPFADLSVIIEAVESDLIIQILSNIIHIWWGKSSLLLSFYNILLVFLSFYSSLTLKVLCHVLKEKKKSSWAFFIGISQCMDIHLEIISSLLISRNIVWFSIYSGLFSFCHQSFIVLYFHSSQHSS